MTTSCFLAVLTLLLQSNAATDDLSPPWTQWGGSSADFVVRDGPKLVDGWGEEGPKVLWKRELGAGYASILHLDERLFTAYREEDHEIIVALDARTGETVWDHAAPAGRYDDMDQSYGEGPNSTPLIVGDRLVHSDINGVLRCLDLEYGDPLWSVDLHGEYGRQARREEYGYSGIHLEHQGNILVLVGGDEHGVVALDPKDGSLVWGSEPFRVSYAPPVLLPLLGREQLVLFSPTEVLGLDPANGEVLWRYPVRCGTENNLTTAVLCEDDQLWISSQFDGATRLLKLREEEGAVVAEQVWFNRAIRQCHWNVIRLGTHVYGSMGNVGSSQYGAADWRTGEIAWRHRGLHAAQCIYADGKMLLLSEDGELTMAKVSPEGFEILGQHQVAQPVCWSIPTLVGTTLYLRDTQHIQALDLSTGD